MKSNLIRPVIILAVLTAAAFVYFNASPQAQTPEVTADAGARDTTAPAVHGFDYLCEAESVSLRLHGETAAELQIGTDTISMTQTRAASGVRYASAVRGDETVVFHTKGDEAVLMRNGTDTNCRLAKAPAGADVAEDQTAAQAAVETAGVELIGTDWQLDSIGGGALPADTSANIIFEADRVGGRGGCNSFGGSYTRENANLRFGPLMSTKMACSTPRMELELRLHDLLGKVDSYAIDDSGALNLKSGEETLMTFRAAAAKDEPAAE